MLQSHHSGIESELMRYDNTMFVMLQSHHSGIESAQLLHVDAKMLTLQSHHSGIESELSDIVIEVDDRCNRTIVGLKEVPQHIP